MATASKNGARELAEGTFTGLLLDPRKIKIEKGFNARDFDLSENQEHVENLARSIAAVGVQTPLVVRMDKGEIFLVDGESRLRATLLAIKNGAAIKTVPAVQEARHTSEEDRIASLLTRNSGKSLNFLERGEVFARLKNFGWTDADIAKKTGITQAHVSNIMSLHAAPQSIKKMVAESKVAPTLAIETMRTHGDDAVKVLKEAAQHSDGGKVTMKDVRDVPAKKKKERRDPFAFGRTEAKQFLAGLCDIYFNREVDRPQALTICRNIFENTLGSDWKALAKGFHDEVNAE